MIKEISFYKVLYTIPRNINGYVLFCINTLDTIVRGENMLSSHH